MATISIVLWIYDANKQGKHPIKLRLIKDGKKKYFGLGLTASPNQWNEEFSLYKKDKRLNPNCDKDNAYLNFQLEKAKNVVENFEKNKIDYTFNQFKEAFYGYAKKGNANDYFTELIESLYETNDIGNAKCYSSVLNMLHNFDKNFAERVFSEIDYDYILKFEKFLKKPRKSVYKYKSGNTRTVERKGCSGNTRVFYLKGLRAMLNKAIKAKVASKATYPFGEDGFEIGKLVEETEKRYLPTDYLERMKEYVSEKPENDFGRKVFLFSYYCHGMSFIDMALLDKEKNIKRLEDGYYIVYKRYKTRNNKKSKFIYVKLTPQIQQLISEMSDFCQPIDNYLLPLINRQKSDEKSLYEHTRCRLKRVNKYLENLEQEFELSDIHVTTYVSRHTMAMSLQNNAVSREIISQVMGHNNLETTNTYLDSFANKEINKAISVL